VRRRIDRLVVARAALVLALSASGCRVHDDGGAGDTVRSFYAAAAQGDMDHLRAALVAGPRLRGLERRFGALESWATRATKNGTIARVEVLDEGDRRRPRARERSRAVQRRHAPARPRRAGARGKPLAARSGSLPGARAFTVRRSAAAKVSPAGQAG
jgi:hypothetical protein